MSSARSQSDPSGSFSQGNAPQVIVRAGKYFVCSSCGTLVEIPADVVGQLVLAVDPTGEPDSTEEETEPEAATAAEPTSQSSVSTDRAPTRTAAKISKPKAVHSPRPPRPKRPAAGSFNGQMIDGLRVPSAEELDRALAWVSFHLTVLDRQGSEIKRLQTLVKKQQRQKPRSCRKPAQRPHACADDGPAPAAQNPTESPTQKRGPP